MPIISTYSSLSNRAWFNQSVNLWANDVGIMPTSISAANNFFYSVSLDSNNTYAAFSASAANVGNIVAAGAGYIFVNTSAGWTQQQVLTASDAAANDNFGYSISISGDSNYVVVGAPYDNIGANTDQGSAYIFSRSGNTWTEQQKLVASDGVAGDRFGESVAIDSTGTRVIIGAPFDDTGANTDQGGAYVFTRTGNTWAQEQKVAAFDGLSGDRFGTSVAIDANGSKIVVGAPLDDFLANTDQGGAYVFTRSGSSWFNLTRLNGANIGDNFGQSVAMSADGLQIMVGAPNAKVGLGSTDGSAYTYEWTANTWTQRATLIGNVAISGEKFGQAVSLNSTGNVAIIGANSATNPPTGGSGVAYIYTRNGTTWTRRQYLYKDTVSGFGSAVSINNSGNAVLIGTAGSAGFGSGANYIYTIYNN